MQMKGLFTHTSEPIESGFGVAPEAFNSVDMTFTKDEFVLPVVDSKVLFVAKVNKPVIASPSIRMDDTFKVNPASDDPLQRGFSAIQDDLGIHFSVAFEDAKNNSFTESATASFALNPASAEETFINFNLSGKRRLPFTKLGNSFSDFCEVSVDSVPVQTGNFSNLGGVQIQ